MTNRNKAVTLHINIPHDAYTGLQAAARKEWPWKKKAAGLMVRKIIYDYLEDRGWKSE